MTVDLEAVHGMEPVRDRLPGEPVPYYLASGEGARYELDGQLWTVIARAADTGGLFDAAYVSGGRGATTPAHAHRDQHRSLLVVDGGVQVRLGGRSRLLLPGDTAHVPAGVPLAYRMLAHHTRLLTWAAPGGSLAWVERLGVPVEAHVHPARPTHRASGEAMAEIGGEFGITFPDADDVAEPAAGKWDATIPAGVEPYFLRAGEGDRVAMPNTLHTYLTRGRNTGDRYFAVGTVGGPSPYFVRHFHREHTENFLCLSGRVWLHVNGQELLLTRGDFVHAPAGTIHTFSFAAHATTMLGILTPSVFEPFFETIGRPTTDHVYEETSELVVPPAPPPAARAELDVVVVGPPPERSVGLDL
ncbi:quercetin 2,3-dioxygenase [Amycolatopsis arida]|uniref:Quercetin 2,3-dioxygenase n=1 Tax=Amycolatopsis arida TaxID=587909 RepID=A0A1I5SPT3_9PSEU|nr:quercetin 2,3-dioxygenase [Amycolatopsis arida]TDX96393.1 quercetin 2,3-dioxygenase [Amycolatopsis arida]SFP72812.1 quercetin 2,3-dioxygenase [Amycolatopsis arida]